jgi:hypothetical protein
MILDYKRKQIKDAKLEKLYIQNLRTIQKENPPKRILTTERVLKQTHPSFFQLLSQETIASKIAR